MAVPPKIGHIDKLANGVLSCLRRSPKDVYQHTGGEYLRVHIRNTEGVAFARSYQTVLDRFDRLSNFFHGAALSCIGCTPAPWSRHHGEVSRFCQLQCPQDASLRDASKCQNLGLIHHTSEPEPPVLKQLRNPILRENGNSIRFTSCFNNPWRARVELQTMKSPTK